jgi:hypothetical protein
MKIELPLDGTGLDCVRRESETVLKSRFLLEILLIMAQEATFYHGQIDGLVPGAGGGYITSVLRRYAKGEMIRYVPVEPGQSRRPLEKTRPDDPLWLMVPAWVEFLLKDSEPQVAHLTVAPSS